MLRLKSFLYSLMLNICDSYQNQWIGPVYSLGQLSGGLFAAFFLDTFGRKTTLTIGALCMELSTALLVWSPSFGVVIAARIIEGVSIGFLLLGYQIYAVEVAAKEDRGFVSSFTLITGNFFGLLAAGIIYGISYDATSAGWRAALGVTFIPATILLCALPFVPESPRFLFGKGKELECRRVLVKLYGGEIEDGEPRLSEAAEVCWASFLYFSRRGNSCSGWQFEELYSYQLTCISDPV
jgi:MFS transporter, SP family, sugar:H+ symporter